MAETTQKALITDEDAQTYRNALNAGLLRYGVSGGDDAEREALEAVAPRLRARWVAEALETIAAECGQPMDDLVGDLTVSAVPVQRLRALATEYRDGKQ